MLGLGWRTFWTLYCFLLVDSKSRTLLVIGMVTLMQLELYTASNAINHSNSQRRFYGPFAALRVSANLVVFPIATYRGKKSLIDVALRAHCLMSSLTLHSSASSYVAERIQQNNCFPVSSLDLQCQLSTTTIKIIETSILQLQHFMN